MGRVSGLAVLASQAINVIVFGGMPDETVSGRCYREGVLGGSRRWARRRRIVDAVFFWDIDHCRRSHENDVAFARMILQSRGEAPPP